MNILRSVATRFVATLFICSASFTQAATTMLYVSNPQAGPSGEGKVTAFDASANGSTQPSLTLYQPPGAWSLAFDSAARLYSMYFLSPSDIYIYPPNAAGHASVSSTLLGYERDATGIAVDSKGYVYVAAGTNTGSGYIEAYAPNSSSPYAVIPLNALSDGITVDNNDNVIITAWGRFDPSTSASLPNALLVFAPQLAGGAPIKMISGPNTGLDSLHTDFGSGGFKVSYSKLSGRLYAGLSGGSPGTSKVLVFDNNASGNAAPLRVITGAATGLKSFVHGLAGNPVTGEIFVLSNDNSFAGGPGVVTAYAQLANGNAAPTRTITDAASQFVSSLDIAFSPPPSFLINSGGPASGSFSADSFVTGGAPVTWSNPVNTLLLTGNIPPQNVLQSDREGNFTYKLTGFKPDSFHSVTAYFVENYFTLPGKRIFNFYLNGAAVLVNFDVRAEAGDRFQAIQRTMYTYANGNGEILIQAIASKDQAKVGAIVVN